ncbi:hypothetical protein GOP47_0003053 [Adiantum capillus-veneris]|uniref:DUF7734 domain-containing protein n=1 Tax=Adiantum capillus-veneris TaxID=13818 RepID=A0A9D4VB89_ADICA|nr:hypothetical protein GOP47_0003053 [Adiantum capillus-veneris]
MQQEGHSSSLMRTTSSNLEDELLPPDAIINGIDRMEGPYNPDTPKFIEKDEFRQGLCLKRDEKRKGCQI